MDVSYSRMGCDGGSQQEDLDRPEAVYLRGQDRISCSAPISYRLVANPWQCAAAERVPQRWIYRCDSLMALPPMIRLHPCSSGRLQGRCVNDTKMWIHRSRTPSPLRHQVATLLGVSSSDLLTRQQQGRYASDTQKVEPTAVLTIPCPGPKS